MKIRRFILVSLVLASASQLPGCGITQWQRDQDAMAAAVKDLHSPEMERRIREAQR